MGSSAFGWFWAAWAQLSPSPGACSGLYKVKGEHRGVQRVAGCWGDAESSLQPSCVPGQPPGPCVTLRAHSPALLSWEPPEGLREGRGCWGVRRAQKSPHTAPVGLSLPSQSKLCSHFGSR